jgi:hypothetical protein
MASRLGVHFLSAETTCGDFKRLSHAAAIFTF